MWVIITSLCIGSVCILYAAAILVYRHWYLQLQPFRIPAGHHPATKFSVIVPARNEAVHIKDCIEGILQQEYPSALFELIVIDDHSEDNTAAIVHSLQEQHSNLKLISLEKELDGNYLNSYKKKAIEIAIGYAEGDWIITTDADCHVGKRWLVYYDAMIQAKNPVFIAAPVDFITDGSMLANFQKIDFMGLQGITAAAVAAGFHSMCNGANLGYLKTAFYETGGYTDIDRIASGDDMLLMHKIKKLYPERMAFLFAQEAIVRTHPMPDWKSFINQRIRWASKADKYTDRSIFYVLAMVYLFNLALLIMPILSIWQPHLFWLWLLCMLIKSFAEYAFAAHLGQFFGYRISLQHWYFPFQHIAYTVIAGWLGKFGTYQWKGRKVK
jgi:cellulose synthase/poly-beta-1,6-N-acetylglucosamine synthase-like glycosyltransferase